MQIVNFALTPANISDNDDQLMHYMLDGLKEQCFGDKGYIIKLFDQGLLLITKVSKRIKNKPRRTVYENKRQSQYKKMSFNRVCQ